MIFVGSPVDFEKAYMGQNPCQLWISAVLNKKEKPEKKFCCNQKPYIFVAH